MKKIKFIEGEALLSQKEKEDILKTVEKLDFDWCRLCDTIDISVVPYHGPLNHRLEVVVSTGDDAEPYGYFGWSF